MIFFIVDLLNSSWFNAAVAAYWKHHFHFSDFLLLFYFLFSLQNQHMTPPPRLKFILWHLKYNSWTESKIKSLPLIDVSKPIWYLERSDLKSSLTTSFALWYGINSILSLFECITSSSSTSLKKNKVNSKS